MEPPRYHHLNVFVFAVGLCCRADASAFSLGACGLRWAVGWWPTLCGKKGAMLEALQELSSGWLYVSLLFYFVSELALVFSFLSSFRWVGRIGDFLVLMR